MNQMKANKVISGNFGKIWINGELYANVKSFEAKNSLKYEPVDIAGEMGTSQKYMGFEGAGTMVLHKIDSNVAKLLAKGVKTGVMPDIEMVGALNDPAAHGAERVKFIDVTFDEFTLLKFANKELQEEEVPFKYADFDYIDMI